MRSPLAMAVALAVLAASSSASSQVRPDSQPAAPVQALRVYLDCRTGGCDRDFFRTEIAFVDHVREAAVAQVHVMVTGQQTGGGGRQFALVFLGRGEFAGERDSLAYLSRQSDTDDEIRQGLARTIALGLVRFAARTPAAAGLRVSYTAPEQAVAHASATKDPWNYWVFETSAHGSLDGERTSRSHNVSGSLGANRTTAAWKIEMSANGHYNENRFVLPPDTTGRERVIHVYTHGFGGDALVVKSLTDHWSTGAGGSVSSSSFSNIDLELPFQHSGIRSLEFT